MAVYIDIYSDYGQIKGGIKVADIDAVQNKLTNLLRCPLGSRFRQPLFGVRLWEFILQPNRLRKTSFRLSSLGCPKFRFSPARFP